MSLPKKRDVDNLLSSNRNKSRPSFSPVKHADRANPSEIKPSGPSASRLTFAEDFTREHSRPGPASISIEIPGSF
jgi:hypothetical protein